MSIIKHNLILQSDAYKNSHPFMVSKDVDGLTSYIEARKGWTDELVFFGLQAFIREYLSKPITVEDVAEAARYAKSAGIPFHGDMWEHVVSRHGGFLPVLIQALPEGSVVGHGVPVVQVTSTDDKYPGLVSVIETALLRAVWYPSSVASLSRAIKKNMQAAILRTSDLAPDLALPFMLNDFGARGTSSGESAAIGGLAHLVNFMGSDTLEAIGAAVTYYDHSLERDGPVLLSVPATEHSVTTINGEDGECDFIGRVIDTFTEQGFPIISTVADSYDMDRFVTEYVGGALKDKVLARDGWLVVRPDSGTPSEVVPRVLGQLWDSFGGTVNSKGFRVLDPHVRVIQGDGVNYDSINTILWAVEREGYSAENVVFGMGGQLLQGVMRDDHSWAMKTNAVRHRGDEHWKDVQKRPKTDMTKASKAGRQAVVYHGGEFHSVREENLLVANAVGHHGAYNWLEDVWDTGETIRTTTFQEVRDRAALT
jgi:nicotinamide phosphoribosyltransferase